MKNLTISTRIYMFFIYILGAALFIWNMLSWQIKEPVMLVLLCFLASLALIAKVEGATNRSHYTFSFIVYAFTFVHMGVPETFIVIIVSNLVEYLYNKPAWFIQVFNTACYIIVIQASGWLYYGLFPGVSHISLLGIMAIVSSMVVFTLLNHLVVGIILWMARGENFKQSGIFDTLPLIIDLTLMTFGAVLALVWEYNPYALVLLVFPIYLISKTLRVPALERKTEIDQKTGLFNHAYFMQHLMTELTRANRFDRPLTVIMADLDLLRNINNTYGHLAGDEVLIKIAQIMKKSVRDYDVVARFGGEEYAIMMPETVLDQGHERAEAIRREIEKTEFTIPTSVDPIRVTISLGIAARENFDQTREDIIHNADTAVYQAKMRGRNRSLAFSHNSFFRLARSGAEEPVDVDESASLPEDDPGVREYPAAMSKLVPSSARVESEEPESPPSETAEAERPAKVEPASTRKNLLLVYLFIGGLFALSLLGLGGMYLYFPERFGNLDVPSWLGLLACALLVIFTEWFSIDLYTKNTSLSTSAVPILAGTLLFGPYGAALLSLTYAVTIGFKYRSPFNRIVFNFSNQLIAGLLYTYILQLTGIRFIELPVIYQLIISILSISLVYVINTALISIGIHLDSGVPVLGFWKEHYSWLWPIYLGMGIVAASFVFGYTHDPIMGSILILIPLILLRFSQIQFVDRTRTMVSELRDKNAALVKSSEEITHLNEGLLDMLAEIIDLRDPYLLGHSRKVTELAMDIAQRLGLHQKQVEQIRKGSLLHDIGKLGIAQELLSKPARLSEDEYVIIQEHPRVGVSLLEKSPSLRPLIPIVRHHHEYFDGGGYPDKISGNAISIEARIVSVADAIEAMSSDRPYRDARSHDYIIKELKACAGKQFDPRIVEVAVQMLAERTHKK